MPNRSGIHAKHVHLQEITVISVFIENYQNYEGIRSTFRTFLAPARDFYRVELARIQAWPPDFVKTQHLDK